MYSFVTNDGDGVLVKIAAYLHIAKELVSAIKPGPRQISQRIGIRLRFDAKF